MTASARGNPAAIDLTREEAWVVHAALLAYIEREFTDGRRADRECALLRKIEGDAEFDADDLRVIRRTVGRYRDDAPARDRDACQRILDDIALAIA